MKKYINPLSIIFSSVILVFILSRLIAWLIIARGILPWSLFVSIDGFRLHHFVYGNFLILVTSFLAIGLKAKINENWLALFYGIGLGLVLDEFPLWLGDINQLNSFVVKIPYAFTAILSVLVIILATIFIRRYKK